MSRHTKRVVLAGLVALAGCANEPGPALPEAARGVAPLSPTAQLVRASMALRGTRPSLADLQAVEADPAVLDDLVDGYLEAPEFGLTMRELHNEALLVAADPDIYPIGFAAAGALAGREVQQINTDLIEAPLRLIEHVIAEDRPYSEIVTADYTLANGVVATVWGLPYDGDGEEWRVTRWVDRPNAGILSDSTLFTRHMTTFSNRNRGRANAVSRALLCYDFLSREIPIDSSIDLADPEEVAHAVRENPACASCHQTLDPLASFFAEYSTIYVPSQVTAYPVNHYIEPLGDVMRVTAPSYFGQAATGLDQLGARIAEDPRFTLCAAKRFYAYFNQVPLADVPFEEAARLQDVFIESGLNAKALAREIVLSDDFRVSHAVVDGDVADRAIGLKKIRPQQLARTVEDLTGFRWQTRLPFDFGWGTIGRVDLVTDNFWGFGVLMGGIDSQNVALPSHTMNASASLVLRGLAAQAAPHVVAQDFAIADPGARRLFTRVSLADTEEPRIREQLAELEARLYGELVDPDSQEVTEAWWLFYDALGQARGDTTRAWTTTLYAMLQDIRLAYY